MGSVLEKMFKERFLKTPLVRGAGYDGGRRHWDWCVREIMPCATFKARGRYGEYSCDLMPIQNNGLCLSEAGCQQMRGILEAFFARWFIDRTMPKRGHMVYTYGPASISIKQCPVGEEVYIHRAVCQVLHRNIEFRDYLDTVERLQLIEKFRELVRSEKGGELKFEI